MTSGRLGAPYFRRIRPGAGFKTGDFAEEQLGGGYHRTTLPRFSSSSGNDETQPGPSTGRVGSGQVGSGRVGSRRVGSGRVEVEVVRHSAFLSTFVSLNAGAP